MTQSVYEDMKRVAFEQAMTHFKDAMEDALSDGRTSFMFPSERHGKRVNDNMIRRVHWVATEYARGETKLKVSELYRLEYMGSVPMNERTQTIAFEISWSQIPDEQ